MTTQAIKQQQKRFSAHRRYQRMYFKANDMDFVFQWLMGSAVNGGVSIGESFYTASCIKDGNPESWAREWTAMAQRVQQRAETGVREGHLVSGREAYLRAAVYYRAILTCLLPDDARFKTAIASMRECFNAGGALFDPPIESIAIRFENVTLPGYFQKATNDSRPCPTLLMLGGAETFAEDLYYYIAPAALKRGYNFATVDLPGQGDTPYQGLAFRYDTEAPVGAVLDYLLSRPDVDPLRVAAYGISAGGYFVPRAAAHDLRIKACIANSMIFNFYEFFTRSKTRQIKGWVKKFFTWKAPFAMRMAQLMAWRWGVGVEHIDRLVEANRQFFYTPAHIKCPTLILIGEGEYQNPHIQQHLAQAIQELPHPCKKLVIAPLDEGAGSHCIGENVGLMSQLVFDWLEEVFANVC